MGYSNVDIHDNCNLIQKKLQTHDELAKKLPGILDIHIDMSSVILHIKLCVLLKDHTELQIVYSSSF